MRILVIGSGGREHSVVRKLKESVKAEKLYCAPGNAGIAADAECVNISAMDIAGIVNFSKDNAIDLVFVTPDDPLVAGMVDALEAAGIKTFGPNKAAAIIEGSKAFSKALMKKYGIPTAAYDTFTDAASAMQYIKKQNKYPVVIKADGLALGKGVIIAENEAEAEGAVKSMINDGIFGASGKTIVVEEFLEGTEVSVLAFTDSVTIKPMASSKDHKRAQDGDMGANTGGMGTISPNPRYTPEVAKVCMEKIFLPTIAAMREEGRAFKGCLYFGLILTDDGPKVIEYNARFGDPEAQVVLPLLKTDFIDIILAIYENRLSEIDIEWENAACACVIMASGGYPAAYEKGKEIFGLNGNGQLDYENVTVYHAGTKSEENKFLTNGGRVLGVTAKAETLEAALEKAYSAVSQIRFDGVAYRTDIGKINKAGA